MPQGVIIDAARDGSYFHPEAVLFGRKKEKKYERKMGDEYRKLYIGVAVNAS